MTVSSNSLGSSRFCREREAFHRAKAKDADSSGLRGLRGYHEREASSWAQEAMFYEAVANGLSEQDEPWEAQMMSTYADDAA